MTAVAARGPPARRRGRRLLRPARQLRRPPKASPRKKKRWRLVLLAAVAVLALWTLWSGTPQRDEPSPGTAATRGSKTAAKTPAAETPEKAQMTTLAPTPPSPRFKVAPAPPVQRARRDLLLAAVRARAASLRPCVPDASELQVPVRLHVTRTGTVKALEFTGGAPPRPVAECLRKVATGWSFRDVSLPSDVELFATLALSPGA